MAKNENTGLVKYDAMCQAIALCHSADEAKQIRNQARAIEVYARQARNRDAELKAAEIRLRAERRAGQLLKEMKRNGSRHNGKGNNPSRLKSETPIPTPPVLKELGITLDQSSQWQRLAEVPEEQFEHAIRMSGGMRPSTEGIINSDILRQHPTPQIDPAALWIWGRLKDFEREGIFDRELWELISGMPETMQNDCERLVPQLITWLKRGPHGKSNRAA